MRRWRRPSSAAASVPAAGTQLRAGWPPARCASSCANPASSWRAARSPARARGATSARARSTAARSASSSSVSTIPMSRRGSTFPSTWATSPAKHRTTWTSASTSRMWARNWFPRPSPLCAFRTRPAMSTSSSVAGTIRRGRVIAAMASSRGSGMRTTPTFGAIVVKGYGAISACAAVIARNSVDFPALGSPTRPQVRGTRSSGERPGSPPTGGRGSLRRGSPPPPSFRRWSWPCTSSGRPPRSGLPCSSRPRGTRPRRGSGSPRRPPPR